MDTSHRIRSIAILCLVAGAMHPLAAQPPGGERGGPPPAGLNRETMWFAPTAEDWAKPCLVPFQRTYEDAVALSKATGKPILVCVNMDGEIASEHYAGVRYRQPEIAKLYEPYVCVIASVYRHNPRDHDEEGRRILCPRFGSVTCGEHIAIEPGLFDRFFEGRRVAPRHIGVDPEKGEFYDVYYAWDTDSVFQAIQDGVAGRPPPRAPRGDRSILERAASRDNGDRTAVEAAYLSGDKAVRKALLETALAKQEELPVDLLRLALDGLDPDLARSARQALVQARSPAAIDLILEALRVPLDPAEREGLVATLDRLGGDSVRARTLSVVHRGLGTPSSAVPVAAWLAAIEESRWDRGGISARGVLGRSFEDHRDRPDLDPSEIRRRVEERHEALRGADGVRVLELAEALLLLLDAEVPDTPFHRYLLEDARAALARAGELGSYGPRVDVLTAALAAREGDVAKARRHAGNAVMGGIPENAGSSVAALSLALFAEGRQRQIEAAIREKQSWPADWLADVHAAYTVLARHPRGQAAHAVAHYDFLLDLGARAAAKKILDDALSAFPGDGLVHNRLRGHILFERGARGLEAAYAEMLRDRPGETSWPWFAGYASTLAAEYHRREQRADDAVAAYERAIAHFERSIEMLPDSKPRSDHYIALAHGGLARVAYERGDDAKAVEHCLAAFARSPDSAATLDGLNLSPVDTAKVVRARLKAKKEETLAQRLETGLQGLDPRMLELPAYERGSAPAGERPRRGRRPPGG
jgi:tetratricopeptide (TPR) repeat protein